MANLKFTLSSLAMLALFGCAAMQQEFVRTTCNKEGAFQRGYNDAAARNEMNNSFSGTCPDETQSLVQQAYREGYTSFQAPTQINIITEAGEGAGWDCREAYGRKTCGYDCKEAFGHIKCARFSGHNCLEAYGKIRCGRNCREEFGQIKCDEYE